MEVTREDVVERAITIFDSCGYIWGAWPGTKPTQYCRYNQNTAQGEISSSGPYIATDCSGFTSWCWALGYKRGSWSWSSSGEFGKNYRPRANTSAQTYTEIFPGIQPGDVLWREGHVGLYIGNNQCMEASTQKWAATPTGRGMKNTNNSFNFSGYVSFDGTFAEDYNPIDTDIIKDNVSDGEKGPDPFITDVSGDELYIDFHDMQYTKRYWLMKRWRRL